MWVAAALAIPAVLVCWLWYWLLLRIDQRSIFGKRRS